MRLPSAVAQDVRHSHAGVGCKAANSSGGVRHRTDRSASCAAAAHSLGIAGRIRARNATDTQTMDKRLEALSVSTEIFAPDGALVGSNRRLHTLRERIPHA